LPRSQAAVREIDRVAVVGGGVIGLWTAHQLHAAGVGVTVLERDRVGSGASRANAGEVCPALALPLPEPGIVAASMRTLHRRDSALFIRPQPSIELARFMLGFAWRARAAPFAAGARALRDLGSDAVRDYRELEGTGIDLRLGDLPFLSVHDSQGAAETARGRLQRLAGDRFEISESVLDERHLAALEPCVDGAAGFLVGGQITVDPSALVDGLAARLRAEGIEIREGARVTGVDARSDAVTVMTSEDRLEVDAVVLAAGVWSTALAASIGQRLPIFPGKGYSFIVRIDEAPRHPILLDAPHVVITPLHDGTRIAGTMELDRRYDHFDRRRVEAIVAAARPYVRGVDWDERWAEWVGPRPMTPTGLPLIGPIGESGRAFVAAGHNMYGVTLAPGTGRAVAQLITRGRSDVDLAPFAPSGRASTPTAWRAPRTR
jgi:D-amino-acid dehydrogenase